MAAKIDPQLTAAQARAWSAMQAELNLNNLRLKELQEESSFLERVLDNMDVLLVILDRKGNVLRVNRACERLFGYTLGQVTSKLTTGELPLPKEVGAFDELLENLRLKKRADQHETFWRTSAGELRTISWSVHVLFDRKGEVEYIFASGADVTARKRAESLLMKERALLQSLVNSIPDLIFYKDKSGAYLGCNKAFELQKGIPCDQIAGLHDRDLYDPGSAQRFWELDQQVILGGNSLSYEDWSVDASGNPVLFETRKTPYFGPRGEILGVIGIGRDITRHRLVENELRQAKSEIEQLISSMSSVLIVLSIESRVTHWNASAQTVLGIPAEEAVGRMIQDVPIHWDQEVVLAGIQQCKLGGKAVYPEPIRFQKRDGRDGYLGINISPLRQSDEAVSGFIILCGDITERKILENRLAQAQKLESIGQLAAGIAHEINTPIQYIGDNTTFLRDSFSDLVAQLNQYAVFVETVKAGEATRKDIERIEGDAQRADLRYLMDEIPAAIQQSLEGIQRVSEIVRAMKEFSHPGVKEKAPLDVNQALESTLTVCRNEWKYVAEVETDLCPDLPRVVCTPGEINQVFLNIIVNAAQALQSVVGDGGGEKGVIRVATRRDGAWVEIRISDTGPGIPEEIQSRIFEPFFTTKEVGKGSGQGLAIAYDVVERKHGGSLNFESCKGQGSTFIIRLPIQPALPGLT